MVQKWFAFWNIYFMKQMTIFKVAICRRQNVDLWVNKVIQEDLLKVYFRPGIRH